MIREQVLDKAKELTVGRRDEDYGSPGANFLMASRMISSYFGWDIKPHEVAVIMMITKLCRIRTSHQKADNWLDIAGYAACGAEVARVYLEDADTDDEPEDEPVQQGQ